MKYIVQITVEELQQVIEQAISQKLAPLENAVRYLTEHCDDELLKIGDVCAKLQVSDRTIRNWVKSKKIKCYWIGDRQFFRMKDVIECMQSNF